MSVTNKDTILVSKVVEQYVWRSDYTRDGVILTPIQMQIWKSALVLLSLAWLDILPSEQSPIPRWLRPWLRVISTADVIVLVQTVKLANEWLLETHSMFVNYSAFKQHIRQFGGRADIVSPTKIVIDRWCLERDPDDLRLLRIAFSFITRVSLPDLQVLKDQAAVRYLTTDSSLPCDSFTREEGEIIRRWFPYENLCTLLEYWDPMHGPGSTANAGDSKIAKYQQFESDDMIGRLDRLLGGNTMPYTPTKKLERTAKVVFVPKTVDKLRTICMEPSTLMWYQEGFASSIATYIERHKYLRKRINLEDQSYSQELAYLGSIDGNLATIDLSDASDRVSWSLVLSWMRHSSLLPVCWMTRSRRATVAGEVLVPKKYAPMGSALCFPLECIIFCAIVEASIEAEGGSTRDSLYRVYGDDIIVETRYAFEVIRRLTQNGFVVNSSKSFFRKNTHNFRESCGGEFFDGVDVTPIRLPRRFSGMTNGDISKASTISDLVSLANACHRALPSVRRYIIWDLLKLPKVYRPLFDGDGETGIYSSQPTNFHLEAPVYVKRYQQWYLKHGHSSLIVKDEHEDEALALYEQLRGTKSRKSLSSPEDRFSPMMSRKPVSKWSVTKTPIDKIASQAILRVNKEREV